MQLFAGGLGLQHQRSNGYIEIVEGPAGTAWNGDDDYERYVTMDALTYKDMFVSLDLLSNNMSGQQCKLPSHIQAAGWPKMRPAHASLVCACPLHAGEDPKLRRAYCNHNCFSCLASC